MNTTELKRLFNTPTTRLAATYLLIIMAMSIGFSIVFYKTSAQQLHRQVPPDALLVRPQDDQHKPDPAIRQFLELRAEEGRDVLRMRLIAINIGALLLGGGLSWWLARRNLRPIEAAMEAQSRFVSDASHELRTPLTAIQTMNEVTLRKPRLSLAEAKEVISHNTEEALKLKSLSDGLLNLARQEEIGVSARPVSLPDVMTEAINQVLPNAVAKGISIDEQVPKVSVLASHFPLVQVVVIILDNAIKYSRKGSTIVVTAERHGRYIRLHIIDQGDGISEADLPHIFERFYRADSARSNSQRDGYGLGLAIAHAIIRQMHGTIGVTSKIGKGSHFVIALPIAKTQDSL